MMHKFTSTRRFQASALALALAATVCFSSLVSADNRFTDVPEAHWAHDAIEYVVDEGLFAGTSETTFNPEGTMTRAMLWVVLARMDDANTNASSGEAWYQPGLDWAVENGISDGTNPNNNITREQFAAMLYRYAENAGEDITADTAELNKFIDTINISSYALQPLAWAVENGIVSGTSSDTISPAGNATRAQVATMLMRYDKAFNDDTQSDNPGGETTQPENPSASDDVDYTMKIALMNHNLSVGDKVVADVNTIPSTAKENLTYTFKSSDTSVVTVKAYSGNNFSCEISAVGPGTAIITATDSNGIEATLTVTVAGTSTSNPGTSDSDDYADVKDEIIELTNEVRAENGVGALTKSDLLMEIAQQRAEESAESESIEHFRPDGSYYSTIFEEYGLDRFEMQYVEILGWSTILDSDYIVDLWENSPGHFASMTGANKTLVGVGISVGEDGRYYFCQVFTDKD
jgi:hypothetical protein